MNDFTITSEQSTDVWTDRVNRTNLLQTCIILHDISVRTKIRVPRNTPGRGIIRKYGLFDSKTAGALGMMAIVFGWGTSFAGEPALVKKSSRLSLRKTTAAALPTQESMMFTNISISADADPALLSTLCLAVDLGAHHLVMEDEVELIGLKRGHTIQAKIETLEPREEGNLCSGNSMMVTTDLSDLNSMNNDLYTGDLNITISTE